MGSIVPFKPKVPDNCATGEAVCYTCGHSWQAVAPIGVIELECPKCKELTGKWLNRFRPSEGYVYHCGNCNGETWVLTPDGALCESCGVFDFNVTVNN